MARKHFYIWYAVISVLVWLICGVWPAWQVHAEFPEPVGDTTAGALFAALYSFYFGFPLLFLPFILLFLARPLAYDRYNYFESPWWHYRWPLVLGLVLAFVVLDIWYGAAAPEFPLWMIHPKSEQFKAHGFKSRDEAYSAFHRLVRKDVAQDPDRLNDQKRLFALLHDKLDDRSWTGWAVIVTAIAQAALFDTLICLIVLIMKSPTSMPGRQEALAGCGFALVFFTSWLPMRVIFLSLYARCDPEQRGLALTGGDIALFFAFVVGYFFLALATWDVVDKAKTLLGTGAIGLIGLLAQINPDMALAALSDGRAFPLIFGSCVQLCLVLFVSVKPAERP